MLNCLMDLCYDGIYQTDFNFFSDIAQKYINKMAVNHLALIDSLSLQTRIRLEL